MISNKNIKNLEIFKRDLLIITFVFTLAGLLIVLKYFNVKINTTYFYLQISILFLFICYLIIGYSFSAKELFFLVLSFQIITSLIVYYYYHHYITNYWKFAESAFPDSLTYKNLTEDFRYLSFTEILRSLLYVNNFFIDDLGFPIFLYLISQITQLSYEEFYLYLILIYALMHSIASYYLFKLSCFFVSDGYARIAMLIWGLASSITFISCSGLKEVLFSMISLLCVYHMHCYFYNRKIRSRIYFYIFLLLTILFRIYITFFFFVTYIAIVHFRKMFNKYFGAGIICFILFAYIAPQYLGFIHPALGAVSIQRNLNLMQSFGNSGLISNVINFVLGWVGSIPNFKPTSQISNIVAISFSIVKFYFSFIFIFCVYKIIVKKITKLYTVCLIAIFNVILTIVTCFSLDFRFMLPTVYLYYIIIAYFYENKEQMLFLFNKKISLNILHTICLPCSLLLFFFYNR